MEKWRCDQPALINQCLDKQSPHQGRLARFIHYYFSPLQELPHSLHCNSCLSISYPITHPVTSVELSSTETSELSEVFRRHDQQDSLRISNG